jgi:2-polyprenyl-3-methyl-5-hydroxy-6-metoxy-1,4-benzoquinol methylase
MDKSNSENDEKRLQEARQYWDNAASTFDDKPDHGLRDPFVLEAWSSLLKKWLPSANSTILDIGCGTGSLSIVLAGLGHQVTGFDLSPAMISIAKAKANSGGFEIEFHVMDAAFPALAPRRFDAIICRHLLWALPEPEQVLQRWMGLLKQKGRCILVDGYWGTGGGIHAQDVVKILPTSLTNVEVKNLSDNPDCWGGPVTDERYAIIADLK